MQPVKNNSKEEKPVTGPNAFPAKRFLKLAVVTKVCAILAVISCLVYANTLKNGYVLDDVIVITENHYVQQGFAGIPLLLETTHYKGFETNATKDYYRPLSLVMFAIEYEFFGLNPAIGHLFNILVFAACVVVLFLFLNKLFNGEKIVIAFVASLLFAVHPIHTEVVANIKSRDELLCFFFAFLSLNIFIDYTRQGRLSQLLTGAFCLFLSLLSKETAVTFIGIIPLVFFFYKNESKKRSLYITVSTATVIALFIVAWAMVVGNGRLNESGQVKLIFSAATAMREKVSELAVSIFILGYYLKFLFVPYPLLSNYEYSSFPIAEFGNIGVVASLAAYCLLGYAGIRRLFKNKKDPWAFSILFYLISISIFSNIPFRLGLLYASRFEFFGSVGFCLAVALAYEKWILKTQVNDVAILKNVKALAVLIPVLLCYSIMAVARNADWKDNFTLVNADLSNSPDDALMQYKAGLELQEKYSAEPDSAKQRQINEESIKHFSKSLEIKPGYTEAHSDIGVAYLREKNYDSAEFHFKRTLELNPLHLNSATNLGTLFFEKQQFRDAVIYYQKAIRIDSNIDIAWYNSGICYARLQQPDFSIWCMKKVIEIAPQFDNYKSYGNVAIMYKMIGNMDSARKYEQITKQYFPGFHL